MEASSVSRLVQCLVEQYPEATSIEIAETLWLATQIEPASPEREGESIFERPKEPVTTTTDDDAPVPKPDLLPSPKPQPKIDLATPVSQVGVLPTQVLPVSLADPPMLPDALAIIRALKPLMQKVAAGTGERLDEAATVDNIARTQLFLPVLKPEEELWLDVVLVIDRGRSMHIWQRLAQDIVRILRRYGAFRNVQIFDLLVEPLGQTNNQTNDDRIRLISNPQRPGHRPREVIDQQGRRIVIMLSDCAGTYWWDGTLLPMLRDWGDVMPTVVWQVLPPWMWKRTALGRGKAVALKNDVPGVANQQLQVQFHTLDISDDVKRRMPVPVITSDIQELSRWSLMVAGDLREVVPGFLLPHQGGRVPRSQSFEDIAKANGEKLAEQHEIEPQAAFEQALAALAQERVKRFREFASPQAQRLIMLLAAAPVITPPVVRLIRDSMLYNSQSPLPMAEVFLSGLIQRLPSQTSEEITDLVQYDFVPAARRVLLELLPAVDTIDVVNSVSAAVEKRWSQYSDQSFRAFLFSSSTKAPPGLENLRSFASVTAEILEPLGGEYAKLAQELRRGSEPDPRVGQPPADEFEIPELRDIETVIAKLVDADAATEPEVVLIVDEYDVATIEIEGNVGGLELLQYVTPIIVRQSAAASPSQGKSRQELEADTDWVIQRQNGSAYRYVEGLASASEPSQGQNTADRLELEMVSIPGGTFTMGSPDTESERRNTEGPRHQVTMQPFFIGRYPITQAQWSFVATLEQIDRRLEADPSAFKGDRRPVENVSWYEAVEFCQRLSRHTGNEYRLPTEAEWEYACRAGTETPFAFGETISSELANYDGSNTYNGGPPGEYRQKTTPVEHIGMANAWGLADMHGNVWEWCRDHWHSSYEGAPMDGRAWVTDGDDASRVIRGGSWFYSPRNCRSASRFSSDPDGRGDDIGFRVVCIAPRALQT